MPINIQPGSRLYSYQDNTKPNVWMSHGDEATKLPDGFSVVAKSEQVRDMRTKCRLNGKESGAGGIESEEAASSTRLPPARSVIPQLVCSCIFCTQHTGISLAPQPLTCYPLTSYVCMLPCCCCRVPWLRLSTLSAASLVCSTTLR
jgi:hypothetical protein